MTNKKNPKEIKIVNHIKKQYRFSESALKIAEKRITKAKMKKQKAKEFLQMATSYLYDSLYFLKKKEYIRAIASIYYAHAWLDAGARLGFWKPKGKEKKFFSID